MRVEEVIKKLEGLKPILQEKYKVSKIGIFGSVVRGEAKEESDIDILVEFKYDAKISLLEFVELENFLSELLGIKVDLVEKSVLKPRIGKHILREVIYV